MTNAPWQRAYIGLGANLGDARATLRQALDWMAGWPLSRLVAVSGFYQSAPIQAQGPDYTNAVAALDTGWSADRLLAELQSLERASGRERPYQNAPRTLDLDLLLLGQTRLNSDHLVLPHPRLHQRAFVLRPLLELAPELVVPGLGRLADRLASVAGQRATRLAQA